MAAAVPPAAGTAVPPPPRLVASRSDLGDRVAPQQSAEYDRRSSRSTKPSIGGQSVAALLREAKALTLDLRTAIKRKDPWDREVEFQRESVRKAYSRVLFSSTVGTSSSIALLAASSSNTVSRPSNALGSTTSLVSPSASHSARLLEALNSLWLETSHSIINAYRSRISAMDKALAEAPQAHRKGGARGEPPPPGPTARRKLVHSFRTFLAKEEEYFATLLGRLASDLGPNDLEGFKALGVVVDPVEVVEGVPPRSDDDKRRARSKAVPLVHKALICFGDLARYRELFNEHSGPHAKERGGRRGNKSKATSDGGSERNKPKNYSRASACYVQAKMLMPENGGFIFLGLELDFGQLNDRSFPICAGNPSNQLAVISGYTHDTLSSTYHYFRALSVRIPFPTARINLELAFNKAVTRWFDRPSGRREPTPDFAAAFIALHGLLFTKKRLSDIATLSAKVENLFQHALQSLELSPDTIVKMVVTGLCSLWDARVHRSSSNARKTPTKRSAEAGSTGDSSPSVNINLEPHILLHVLSMYTILLRICTSETVGAYLADTTKQSPKSGSNLAQNISAVVRRALPALRVLSRWLTGQLDYIHRVEFRLRAKEVKIGRARAAESAAHESEADTTHRSSSVSDGQRVDSSQDQSMETDHVNSASLDEALTAFWTSYADFANSLKLVFPTDGLPDPPDGGVWLEEDIDMLGFAPLRRGMKDVKGTDVAAEASKVGKELHPNEEHLMRIAELQSDAAQIIDSETDFLDDNFKICPVVVELGAFVLAPPISSIATTVEDAADEEDNFDEAAPIPASSPTKALSKGVDSLDLFEQQDEGSEPTEDDPVDLAMRIAAADRLDMQDLTDEKDDDDDDDDDEGHIVYRSRLNLGNASTSTRTPPPPGISPRIGTPASSSAASSKRNSMDLRSLWDRPPGDAPLPPGHHALPPPHQGSRSSFEALPNMTHQGASYAPTQSPVGGGATSSIWAPTSNESGNSSPSSLQRQGSSTVPSPLGAPPGLAQPQSAASTGLFGPASPFSPSGSGSMVPSHSTYYLPSSTPYGACPFNPIPYHAPPLFPPSNAAFGSIPTGSQSDLSPSAFPFISGGLGVPRSNQAGSDSAWPDHNGPYPRNFRS
ncbi:BQ2448_4967 [Microbotryum intermedium]|uniref:BQ2448_4967 protein n=1 Tax=Microbotryum intermedium TaxID=269621 RepID=A0A238FJU0_9BASI|nr:BQ2448_4967 [Microbotryum intermedium]